MTFVLSLHTHAYGSPLTLTPAIAIDSPLFRRIGCKGQRRGKEEGEEEHHWVCFYADALGRRLFARPSSVPARSLHTAHDPARLGPCPHQCE